MCGQLIACTDLSELAARSVHSATNGEMHLETVHKVCACARIWL